VIGKARIEDVRESGTYRRSTVAGPAGEMRQNPPRSRSRSAAKMEGLSNLGRQSQSIDPFRDTKAAERQSPMMP